VRFIHTADWQIGKPFPRFAEKEIRFRAARLDAIEAIGRLAQSAQAEHVLVAGDVYDSDAPTLQTLHEPLERMRLFPAVHWHLLPGNHDPHRPKGVWDRVLAADPPGNIHPHLEPEPYELGAEAVLLPAPLRRNSELRDLTEWMDGAETAAGKLRIGLAHGSATGFGTDDEVGNPVSPARVKSARLDYLALGDWHRTKSVNERTWYAGTPEPDRNGSQEVGTALLVEIDGRGATPRVTQHEVGTFRWLTRSERLEDADGLEDLERRIRALPEISKTVLRLKLEGALPLSGLADVRARCGRLRAALAHLDIDEQDLLARPAEADLEAIDLRGVLREAAERLRVRSSDSALSAEDRRLAEGALVELYLRVVSPEEAREASA